MKLDNNEDNNNNDNNEVYINFDMSCDLLTGV